MLTIYRRHVASCARGIAQGRAYTKCSCPLWCDGTVRGKEVRQSLKTRDWIIANTRAMEIEAGHAAPKPHVGRDIGWSVTQYLEDCERRRLAENTLRVYRLTLRSFADFCKERGVLDLSTISPTDIAAFRDSAKGRKDKDHAEANTANSYLIHLRSWLKFCVSRGWLEKSPAAFVRRIKGGREGTDPYTDLEVSKLLQACENDWERALLLVLLHTGLRISDVSSLTRDKIDWKTGYMVLRITKTGEPLQVHLQPAVLQALGSLPVTSGPIFANAKYQLRDRTQRLWHSIHDIGVRCGVHAHPHRFRSTFAVSLLRSGADLRSVQHLLGHRSIVTTERAYARFSASQQALLDTATARLSFDERGLVGPIRVNALGD